MKVKSNLRAGSGGASGNGHNSNDNPPYVPPVSRCSGY